MPDYKAMYFKLASKTADTVEALDKLSRELKAAQCEAEEMYIEADGEPQAE